MNFSKFQGLFDKVVCGLLAQGERCRDGELGVCLYRLGELRCAAGHMIPDEIEISETCNSMEWGDLLNVVPELYDELLPKGEDDFKLRHFGCHLQEIHDCKEPSEWKESLAEFAEAHELTMPG